jgi:hypothetical protein
MATEVKAAAAQTIFAAVAVGSDPVFEAASQWNAAVSLLATVFGKFLEARSTNADNENRPYW